MLNLHLLFLLFYLAPTALSRAVAIPPLQSRDQLSSDDGFPALALRAYQPIESRAGRVKFWLGVSYMYKEGFGLPDGIVPASKAEPMLLCIGPEEFVMLTDQPQSFDKIVLAEEFLPNLGSFYDRWILGFSPKLKSNGLIKPAKKAAHNHYIQDTATLRNRLGLPPLDANIITVMTLRS